MVKIILNSEVHCGCEVESMLSCLCNGMKGVYSRHAAKRGYYPMKEIGVLSPDVG